MRNKRLEHGTITEFDVCMVYSIIIGYYLRYALTLVSVVLAFLLYIALRAYIAERE